MQAVETCRQRERGHPLAAVERIITDIFHASPQIQFRYYAVAREGIVANGYYSRVKRDGGEFLEITKHFRGHHGAGATHREVEKGLPDGGVARCAKGGLQGEVPTYVERCHRQVGERCCGIACAVDNEGCLIIFKSYGLQSDTLDQTIEDIVGYRFYRSRDGYALYCNGIAQCPGTKELQLIVEVDVLDALLLVANEVAIDTHHAVGLPIDNDIGRHKHKIALTRSIRRVNMTQNGKMQSRTILVVVIVIADVSDNGAIVFGKTNVLNIDIAIDGPVGHVGIRHHSEQRAEDCE